LFLKKNIHIFVQNIESMDKKAITETIKQRMLELNMNNEDLAERSGLSSMTIGRIVNSDRHNLTLSTLEKICHVLDLNIIDVFGEKKDEEVGGYIEYNGNIVKIRRLEDLKICYNNILERKVLVDSCDDDYDKSGYCYIMKDLMYPDLCKIGKSKKPKYREETLSHTTPTISLYKVVKTDNYSTLESKLHKIFNEKRYRGEWFKLTDEDIEFMVAEYGFEDYE